MKAMAPRDKRFSSLLLCVEQQLSRHAMLSQNARILLALSGGKDSVCLFHLLLALRERLGFSLFCGHVHHGIREGQADRDLAFCRALCAEHGVALFEAHCDVPALQRAEGLTLEEAARVARYRALHGMAEEHGALIATAHTATDQTETVLMQLMRGTATACGISPVRQDGVIRPLLSVTELETRAFCEECGYQYVEDSTNRDEHHQRNFLRHSVLPALRQRSPALDRHVAEFCQLQQSQRACLAMLSEQYLEKQGYRQSPRQSLSFLQGLCDEPTRPLLYRVLSDMLASVQYGGTLEYAAFLRVCRALEEPRTGAFVELSGDAGFLVEADSLLCRRQQALPSGLLCEGTPFEWAGSVFLLTREKSPQNGQNVHKMHTMAHLNCDRIVGKLAVRPRRAQDSYEVYGLVRQVRDLFSSRGYPLGMRERFPLVCDERGIVWIPGELAADRVRADGTGDCMCLSLVAGPLYEELVKRRQYE